MRKFLLILTLNLFFICLLIFVLDYFYCAGLYKQENINNKEYKPKDYKYFNGYYYRKVWRFKEYWEKFIATNSNRYVKPEIKQEEEKNAIILFGCSFAEGAGLEYSQNFAYKLANMTNRFVYNWGISSSGPTEMVWLSKHKDFYKKMTGNIDYAIFVYIPCSIQRIFESPYSLVSFWTAGYKKKKDNLVEYTPFYYNIFKFYFIRHLMQKHIHQKKLNLTSADENLVDRLHNENFDLLKLYFLETRKELKKYYPNIKFIVIKYPTAGYGMEENVTAAVYKSNRWQELEDEGFIIYDIEKNIKEDIKSDKYIQEDGHPNSSAWDIITPNFVKDLNL